MLDRNELGARMVTACLRVSGLGVPTSSTSAERSLMLGLRPGPGGVTRPAGRRLAACGMPAVTAEPAVTAAPDAAARGRRTRRPNHEAAPHTCIWNGRSSTRRPELARSHHHGSPYPHSPISQRQDLHPPTPLAPRCSMIAGSSGVYLPGTARDHGPRSDASPRDMTGCGGPGWGARPGGSGRVTAAGGYPLTGTMQVIGAGKLGWCDRSPALPRLPGGDLPVRELHPGMQLGAAADAQAGGKAGSPG